MATASSKKATKILLWSNRRILRKWRNSLGDYYHEYLRCLVTDIGATPTIPLGLSQHVSALSGPAKLQASSSVQAEDEMQYIIKNLGASAQVISQRTSTLRHGGIRQDRAPLAHVEFPRWRKSTQTAISKDSEAINTPNERSTWTGSRKEAFEALNSIFRDRHINDETIIDFVRARICNAHYGNAGVAIALLHKVLKSAIERGYWKAVTSIYTLLEEQSSISLARDTTLPIYMRTLLKTASANPNVLTGDVVRLIQNVYIQFSNSHGPEPTVEDAYLCFVVVTSPSLSRMAKVLEQHFHRADVVHSRHHYDTLYFLLNCRLRERTLSREEAISQRIINIMDIITEKSKLSVAMLKNSLRFATSTAEIQEIRKSVMRNKTHRNLISKVDWCFLVALRRQYMLPGRIKTSPCEYQAMEAEISKCIMWLKVVNGSGLSEKASKFAAVLKAELHRLTATDTQRLIRAYATDKNFTSGMLPYKVVGMIALSNMTRAVLPLSRQKLFQDILYTSSVHDNENRCAVVRINRCVKIMVSFTRDNSTLRDLWASLKSIVSKGFLRKDTLLALILAFWHNQDMNAIHDIDETIRQAESEGEVSHGNLDFTILFQLLGSRILQWRPVSEQTEARSQLWLHELGQSLTGSLPHSPQNDNVLPLISAFGDKNQKRNLTSTNTSTARDCFDQIVNEAYSGGQLEYDRVQEAALRQVEALLLEHPQI